MANKVAIVTGASSGIGLATAKVLLAAGWSVFGTDISPAPTDITSSSFTFLQANIASTDVPQTIVSACLKALGGRIDALVNCAGISDSFAGVGNLKDETWDRVISINLTAPVRLMREVVPTMKAQKAGIIINVSSKAGTSGAAAGLAYTCSKHGLVGATKNTAWLYKDDGIRCNAICPGAVKTAIWKSVVADDVDTEALAKIKPSHDLHFNGQTQEGAAEPEGPAKLIAFLVSDLSEGINGAIIPCDNAWSVL